MSESSTIARALATAAGGDHPAPEGWLSGFSLPMAIVSPDGRIRRTNRALTEWLGAEAEQLAGTPWDQLILSPGDLLAAWRGEEPGGLPADRPVEVQGPQGRRLAAFLTCGLDCDPQGEGLVLMLRPAGPGGAPAAGQDRELLFESLDQAVLVLAQGRVQDCNPAASRIFGLPCASLVGLEPAALSPPRQPEGGDSAELMAANLAQAREEGRREFDWEFLRPDGSRFLAEVSLVAGRAGPREDLIAVVADVTNRVRTELALKDSVQRFRSLAENAPDIIYALDRQGAFSYVNPAWERILGHPPDQVLGRYFVDFALNEDQDEFRRIFKLIRDQQRLERLIKRLHTADGGVRHFSMSGGPNLDGEGRVIGMVGMLKDITQRVLAVEALAKSEHSLAWAQRMAQLGNWELDLTKNEVTCSDEAYRIYGIPRPSRPVRAADFLRSVHHDDRHLLEHYLEDPSHWGDDVDLEHRIVRPGGEQRIVQQKAQVVRDQKGRPIKVVGAVQDVTDRRRSEEQMRLLVRVFENTVEAIAVADRRGRIEMVNEAFVTITGFPREEALGRNPRFLSSGRHDHRFYAEMWRTVRDTGQWQGEVWNRRRDGEAYPAWLTITAIQDTRGAVSHYVGVFHDITEIKRSEERISHQAYHDALTGLPNRMLFSDRLKMALAHAARKDQGLAVMSLDLDNFKHINEGLGHAVGDMLLQAVARRVVRWVREEDTVARLGGDEFILLLQGTADPDYATVVARRILDSLARPFAVGGQELFVTASIGITLFPHDGRDAETLVANADLAMYRAKAEGKNACRLFTPAMNTQVVERMALEVNLRRALERSEFLIHYQPKVDLAGGGVVGTEALLRWRRPGVGVIPPDQFIPLAEETGLIIPVGEWVLRQACATTRAWQRAGFDGLTVAVNLSPRQFSQATLVERVAAILEETGLAPECLELEITETALMGSVEQAVETLHQLAGLGVNLSMDDFGRGYSSLYHLKRFPMHSLKIDRYFLREVHSDPDDASIVNTIISMGRSLKLKVVAEGVETYEQLEFLRGRSCDMMQGFLYSRPIDADSLLALLREGRSLY